MTERLIWADAWLRGLDMPPFAALQLEGGANRALQLWATHCWSKPALPGAISIDADCRGQPRSFHVELH